MNHGISSRDSLLGTANVQREPHRGRERVRIRRRREHVESRRVDDVVPPVQPVPHAADRLSVPASDDRFDAALCQSRERVRRSPALPATIRSPINWGPPGARSSRAVSPALEQASTRGRTVGSMGSRPKRCGERAAATTLHVRRSRFGRRPSTSWDSRTRAARSASTDRSPDRTSRTFLLGAPHSAAIAFGNAEKSLRGRSSNAYVTDDWRINPTLTVNLGLRWEYESPFSEGLGRLVNLDVASDFTVSHAQLSAPSFEPDRTGMQPRLGLALRPDRWIVARDSRRMGHLSQHVRLSVDCLDAGAATAAVENTEHRKYCRAAADAGQRIQRTGKGLVEQLRRRSGFSRQLRAQLAGVGSARSAGVAHGHRHVSRNKGQPSACRSSCRIPIRLGAANPCAACPSGFVYLDVEWQLTEERRAAAGATGGCGRV